MKKTTTTLFTVSLAVGFALTGCAAGGSGSGPTSSSTTIGVVLSDASNPYFQTMSAQIKAAADKAGVTIVERDAPNGLDNDTFNNAVDSMVTLGVKGIITAPIGASNLQALTRATDAGIPVVELDSGVPGWDGESALIATDNVQAGTDSMNLLIDSLQKAGKPLNLVIVNNTAGYQSVNDRTSGAEAAIKQAGGTLVQVVDGGSSQADAQDNVETALRAHPEIDGIMGTISMYSLPATQALRTIGIDPTAVLVTGVDGTDAEYTAIKAGTYLGTAAQQPGQMGSQGFATIMQVIGKQSVEKNIAIPPVIVTADNVAQYSN